jgi:hypothetical protein
MTSIGTHIVVWLNSAANCMGQALGPIALMPGWLSATLVGVATGIVMLLAFKHTSNQRAIKQVRRDIRAHLLAIKLFKDSITVGLRAQVGVLAGAGRLLLLALVPMAVMLVPMTLLLAQLALWYQARPLRVGEETVVTVALREPIASQGSEQDAEFPRVELQPADAVETLVGPVRVWSQREVCWSVRALQPGQHVLRFAIDGQVVEKELAVGGGFMPVSVKRPAWDWSEALLHPRESPFRPDAPVRSIAIEYPPRVAWTSGTDYWVVYWFVVSLAAGFAFRHLLGVSL